ncbi:MucR family transcriptional regulator [Rhodopila sp.]|uniref:MucR family transcriptional regulator n=1 Tax=Rhodopila sp. TaxID=2480087 RepID=UPI003D0EDAB7
MTESHRHILILVTQIVAAQVRHNAVAADAIPSLIHSVYNTLSDIGQTFSRGASKTAPASDGVDGHHHNHQEQNEKGLSSALCAYVHPAYGQTVFEDRLICMEDGLSMKMLKRHLLAVHGMTPEEYRAKWDLPDEYPMVASDYAKLRSSLALQSGLGLKPDPRAGKPRKGR